MDWIQHESSAATIVFVASFLLLAIWESRSPAHALTQSTERRWLAHGILLTAAAALQSVLLATSPLVVALTVANSPWGALNRTWMPSPIRFVLAILLLDMAHYLSHRLFHSIGVLWRIHEVHHSDPDYDVSVGARFHPLEVIGAKAFYLAAIALIAPPLAAVFFAGLHTVALNMLVHANVALPPNLERLARRVFITPGLHRIHHSMDVEDQNRNFGQTFVWWDRLLGTHRETSRVDAASFPTGLAVGSHSSIASLLFAPFQRRP